MERISPRQLLLIGAIYVLDSTLISVPAQLGGVAGPDAWLCYLLAMPVPIIALLCLAAVSRRFPGQDLYAILVTQKPVAGRLVAFGYILFFFWIFARDLRSMIDFTKIALLPQTPLLVIGALLAVTIGMIARGGIETVARVNETFAPALIAVIFLMPLLTGREFEMRFIQPFLGQGVGPPVRGAWYAVSYLGEVMLIPFLFSGQTFRFKLGLYGLLFGVLLLELLLISNILALGPELLARQIYPNYALIRQIRLTDFLDRMDLVLAGIYLPSMFAKISFSLYGVLHGLNRIAPAASGRLLAVPISMLGLSCGVWFYENAAHLVQFNEVYPIIGLPFQLLLPLLFWVWLRRPRPGALTHGT